MLCLKNLDRISSPYKERVEEYVQNLHNHFGENLIGVLIFGSVARGKQKIIPKYESDLDILVVIENLAPRFSVERLNQKLQVKDVYSVVAEWMTKEELRHYFAAKTGFILDAFDEGVIVYDPYDYLAQKREELFHDLKRKGVIKKPSLGWVFPIKIGEKIEY